jgi:hypothetical protein
VYVWHSFGYHGITPSIAFPSRQNTFQVFFLLDTASTTDSFWKLTERCCFFTSFGPVMVAALERESERKEREREEEKPLNDFDTILSASTKQLRPLPAIRFFSLSVM